MNRRKIHRQKYRSAGLFSKKHWGFTGKDARTTVKQKISNPRNLYLVLNEKWQIFEFLHLLLLLFLFCRVPIVPNTTGSFAITHKVSRSHCTLTSDPVSPLICFQWSNECLATKCKHPTLPKSYVLYS